RSKPTGGGRLEPNARPRSDPRGGRASLLERDGLVSGGVPVRGRLRPHNSVGSEGNRHAPVAGAQFADATLERENARLQLEEASSNGWCAKSAPVTVGVAVEQLEHSLEVIAFEE